jgi:uncharacterized RDD family membrane protein YckC
VKESAVTSTHERTAQFFEGRRQRRREIITPEGVPLTIDIAEYGDRATAFVIDLFIWLCTTLGLFLLLALLTTQGVAGMVTLSVFLFLTFLVRNLYFIYFELNWQGATPGKRIIGLRVIDRSGGPLLPWAVIARNLTREIEAFIPLGILLTMGRAGGGEAFEQAALALWLLFFSLLPLLNHDRLRGGDLIAGTMVIALPRRVLLSDLVEKTSRFRFTERQLAAYGAFELQVLEELLRRPASAETDRLLQEVCGKICRRIDWQPPVPSGDIEAFLRDFYTAERAHLEHRQLYGKARADKHAAEQER